jgi:putative aldouronate transport system substrate-binding protein
MKKFKVLGLTLAALALLVAGCGKKQATATKDSSGATIIKIAYKDDNSSNKVAKQYYTELAKELKKKEKINVKFKVVDLPSEGYSDKLNLQISSGDIPDIIYFQGGDTPFAQQGVLEDLRPYVKKSKYLKSEMTETNQKRLNNYPYLLWIKPLSASVPVVKKSVLAQVPDADTLIQNPTVDNYKKLLTELVGKKDGKGNAATYGITTAGTVDELDSIFDMAFGNTSTWVKQDGKYVYKRTSDNEKKKIAFYRDLYKQGILDKSFLTKKWDTKE